LCFYGKIESSFKFHLISLSLFLSLFIYVTDMIRDNKKINYNPFFCLHDADTKIDANLVNPYSVKYLWNLLVKFQLDPMVGFEVMLNSIKLDGRKFYVKIQIWPCFGRITRLNRISDVFLQLPLSITIA
jgi:hypothetical protein